MSVYFMTKLQKNCLVNLCTCSNCHQFSESPCENQLSPFAPALTSAAHFIACKIFGTQVL